MQCFCATLLVKAVVRAIAAARAEKTSLQALSRPLGACGRFVSCVYLMGWDDEMDELE